MFEKVYELDNLYNAWLKVKQISSWKEQTQRYEENLLFNLLQLSENLKNKTASLGTSHCFVITERGKKRLIHSYDIDTRIAVRSFIDSVLLPLITPKLIYDNSASIKGKGLDFHRRRIIAHLQKFYRKHGNEGYILTLDFRKFFDNIYHNKLKKILAEILKDKECEEFADSLIDSYQTDISCLSEDEREALETQPFDSVRFYSTTDKTKCDGSAYLRRGVYIGGQLAQIAGIIYPYKLDNFIKIVKGEKLYARYQDDMYVIHHSKNHLEELLEEIKTKCAEYGLFLNEKKTQIVSLNRTFTICKIQYLLKANGDILQKPCKEAFRRERKAIRKFAKNIKENKIQPKDVVNSYLSWRGNISRYDCKRSVLSMDSYFAKKYRRAL